MSRQGNERVIQSKHILMQSGDNNDNVTKGPAKRLSDESESEQPAAPDAKSP